MLALRILPFALVLTIVTPAQQTVFFAKKMVARSAPISMVKAAMRLC
jgi:methylthioribose-1-phosphate isomerase